MAEISEGDAVNARNRIAKHTCNVEGRTDMPIDISHYCV